MPDHPEIYSKQAGQYEALVSHEDYQHNLLPSLQNIITFNGAEVVELGAGTGRLTCLLAPVVKSIQAFDISQHMLDVAIDKLRDSGYPNWQTAVGDHRQIDRQDASADVILSGWSVCFIVVDNPQNWQNELDKVLDEIRRVLRPGGMLILIETLGTGGKHPNPPAHLIQYYAYLEALGFLHTWIRTDYRFESREQADSLTRFFFGDEMVEKIETHGTDIILPECTGIWWLRPE